jgi:hypothetical protein
MHEGYGALFGTDQVVSARPFRAILIFALQTSAETIDDIYDTLGLQE